MARGIAKRTIFECRDDFRFFLSLVAREVRRGTIEVHVFALLQTHFHMLVRSPHGQLSRAMERILRGYARWFNRRRRRDGALFKERFKSKLVDHDGYKALLVRYIDDNPVRARLALHAAAYPYGSAYRYSMPFGPCWLERTWIEAEVSAVGGTAAYDPNEYATRFPSRLPDDIAGWIEGAIVRKRNEFSDLLAPHARSQVGWMVRKALLADGTEPLLLPLPAPLVLDELARLEREQPAWPYYVSREPGSLWSAMAAGLLRHSCALTYAEIRGRTGAPYSTTARRAQTHRMRLEGSSEYTRRTALVIERVQRRLAHHAAPHRYVAVDHPASSIAL
ncbi:MAG: transposase [Planctomycetota bacterium]|jgi:REP element-mobilizing transposase RayT